MKKFFVFLLVVICLGMGAGDVNTAAPGTYELTYYVVDNSGNSSNGAVLTIVVK